MDNCRRIRELERCFDGEADQTDELMRHVDACSACAAHLEELRRFRNGVGAVRSRQEIRDPQFPAFMDGIRERIEPVRRRHGGIWALVSVTAAALIVAISAFLVITDGAQEKVEATVRVESCSTELEGASVTSYASESGVTTVWVTLAQDDIL